MPPAPPVIKIVLLVSFIIKCPPTLCDHLQIALHVDETAQNVDGRSSNNADSQDPARAIAGAGLLASAFPIMSASIFRATEAGTRAFMIRFSRPGMILD